MFTCFSRVKTKEKFRKK